MTGSGEILFEQQGGLAVATLNRPEALNAVNLTMFRAFEPRLSEWGRDPGVRALLLRGAGDRAFCAGGDVRAIYQARGRPLVRGEYTFDMFREEYLFIQRLHRFSKPRIALAHGITMGGGAGLAINGTFRVATETTAIAMPEVFIGSIPDVGATRFFNSCPGRIGLYLALTGTRVGAADALYCGFATHYVPQDRLAPLTAALGEVEWRGGEESAQAGAVLARFNRTPGEATLPALLPAIDRCFGKGSVEAIVAALRREQGAWAEQALTAMQRASPLSLKLTFRQLSLGVGMEIEAALALEFRIIQNLLTEDDFYEGVRAVVVDKDRKPRWRFSSLAEVSEDEVERHFASLGERELSNSEHSSLPPGRGGGLRWIR
jgi:enoyl-CoA hydratase